MSVCLPSEGLDDLKLCTYYRGAIFACDIHIYVFIYVANSYGNPSYLFCAYALRIVCFGTITLGFFMN